MQLEASEIEKGVLAFQQHESRDAMYKVATFLVNEFWEKPSDIANGLGVLLLTWNNAFYRYGSFDFNLLQLCIEKNQKALNQYREKNIISYTQEYDQDIKHLYNEFLLALRRTADGKKSPVSVSKALHLLCPSFFPLWDDKIARAYDSRYDYILFMTKMCGLTTYLTSRIDFRGKGKTLLKLIDEYNYAKHTKGWI